MKHGRDIQRPVRRENGHDLLKVVPVPLMLFLAHMGGGASSREASLLLTLGLAVVSLSVALSSGVNFSSVYLKRVSVIAAPFAVLIALVFLSTLPGSDILGAGIYAEVIGARTLAIDPEGATLEAVKLLGLAFAFLTAYRCASSPVRLRVTLKVVVALGSLWALWSLILYAFEFAGKGLVRLSGPFVSPNIAGAFLAVVLLTGLALVLDPAARRPLRLSSQRLARRLPVVGTSLLLMTALLLTASRSSILLLGGLGLLVSLKPFGIVLRARGWSWRAVASAVAAGAAFVTVAFMTAGGMVSRLASAGIDARDRWEILRVYVEAALQAPVFGYGLGSTPALSRLLLTAETYPFFCNIRAAHNLPVQWWLEMGWSGAALMAAAGGGILVFILRGLGSTGRDRLAPLIAVSAFFLCQGLVDYAVQIYSLALTWAFLLGLQFSVASHGPDFWGEAKADRSARVPRPETLLKT